MSVTYEELQESLDEWAKDVKRENSLLTLNLKELKLEVEKIKEALISINNYERSLHQYIKTRLN